MDADWIWREKKKSDSRGEKTGEILAFHTEAMSYAYKDMHVDKMLCGQHDKQISWTKISHPIQKRGKPRMLR